MDSYVKSGTITGSFTGLGLSLTQIFFNGIAIEGLHFLWFGLSFLLGGIAGGIGGLLGKLLKTDERFGINGVLIGFFAALLMSAIQLWALIIYSLANPVFVP